MALEIERKYLVTDLSWKKVAESVYSIEQGYFPTGAGVTVRVRIMGEHAKLTVKGPSSGIVRDEFEYEIPKADAKFFLNSFCIGAAIEKTRWRVPYGGFLWEVDEFRGDNEGLLVAEIELEHPESVFPLPPWVGREVSMEPRYRNASLVRHPFRTWTKEEKK